MFTSQDLQDRIQKNVAVPWQSQRADGFSDGILFGSAETPVTGVVTTYTPTLDVLKRTVASGKNTVICRENPFYSRGERFPPFFRNGPAPSKEVIENDPVCRAKQEFISQNKLVIIRLVENWDARKSDSQLQGLSRALGWDGFHVVMAHRENAYDPREVFFRLPKTSLGGLAQSAGEKLKIHGVRVIGDANSSVAKVALVHGLLLVADAERILREPGVDAVVAGDAVEWEAGPYFSDLAAAQKVKGWCFLLMKPRRNQAAAKWPHG